LIAFLINIHRLIEEHYGIFELILKIQKNYTVGGSSLWKRKNMTRSEEWLFMAILFLIVCVGPLIYLYICKTYLDS